jgi:ceramide glucosyltransferase
MFFGLIDYLFLASMALEFLVFISLIVVGGRQLRNTQSDDPPVACWPGISLIVPVSGMAPSVESALKSLLTQDYHSYEAIIVTDNEDDPAVPTIRACTAVFPHVRHVCAGRTQTCGQKNHNLLKGIEHAEARSDILVFCDSTHIAPKGFLKALVLPIVKGEARISSGYHHVVPDAGRLASILRTVIVAIMYLARSIPRLNQPWGGATAIDRNLFKELNIDRVWRFTVVDDDTLAALLAKKKILVANPKGACLQTPNHHETWTSCCDWFVRQWLYVKYCFPGLWFLLACNQCILAFAIIFSLVVSVGAAISIIPAVSAMPALISVLGEAGVIVALYFIYPYPVRILQWIVSAYVAIFLGLWCAFRSLVAGGTIRWKGVTYRVGRGGRVEEVIFKVFS